MLQDHFREVTGLPINPYFSAYKLAWLLENVPEAETAVQDGTAMFGTVDTYLIWRLTGQFCMKFLAHLTHVQHCRLWSTLSAAATMTT